MDIEEHPLTERELEVLRLLTAGLTNREIAAELYISTRTAEFHRSNIKRKLVAGSRAEVILRARESGL